MREVAAEGVGERLHRRQGREVDDPHLGGGVRVSAAWISASAFSPFSALRTARITCAPAAASRSAASRPVPLLAPVTTTVRPVWSGTAYIASSS